ncbi:MAG: hypothetical protein JNM19_16130 [Chitinophagaceae bacterium]|nr:hypothetical protein [Chitinophagaceae bacterium]
MKQVMTPEIREVMEAVHYRPAVSVIMPFEPKMNLQTELSHALKMAADKVERELKEQYPGEAGSLVMQKLRALLKSLNFDTRKKSVAIYVSPVFEKILYLDIPVEEKIIVDESFEIRDLVYCKKQFHKYLVQLMSGKESRVYLGNSTSFVRLITNTPESVLAYKNDSPEKVANFSDMSERKEILMEKFLLHIDNSLGLILKAYQLPLFVLGTDRILGHFKKITRHNNAVVKYVHGNYEEASVNDLQSVLAPYISDWKKVLEINLLNQLEEAAGRKKLAAGIHEVWKEAVALKGRLLVVEKNYMVAAQRGGSDEVIYQLNEPYNKYSYIKDAVDDVIEKVLEGGGDVEFTEEGVLDDYGHIALIQYY